MKLSSLTFVALSACLVSCGKHETTLVEPQPQNAGAAKAEQGTSPDSTGRNSAASPLSAEDSAQLEAWWKKYNLNPNDPSQLVADSDGDGYSNREEFLADTNPRDPNSLPGVMEGVVMKTLNEIPVPLVLREVASGKARIQHPDGTMETLGTGATPKGSAFKVKSVRNEVKADKHGVWTDMSQVMLENPETKETVFLMRDLPARSSQTHAVITGADGREQKVHFDETFTIASQPGKQFKVIDLRADQVVVQEIGGKAVLTIPKR